MRAYPIPFNDPARLSTLRNLPGINSDSEPLFNKLTEAVRVLFKAPVAHISIVEDDHQWFKSVVGADLPVIPRDYSFCAHAIMSDQLMVVPDLQQDPRFQEHHFVKNAPFVRFYAGAPIILSTGFRVGSICALDFEPHGMPDEAVLAGLSAIADAIAAAFERKPVATTPPRDDFPGRQEFIALISHELRTPLTKILGYTSLLTMRLTEGDLKLANAASTAARHLNELIEAIVLYSNTATGELKLKEEVGSLKAVINDALAIQIPNIDGRGKRVTLVDFAIIDSFFMDSAQMRLALTALIDNATLHGGEELEIAVTQTDDDIIEIAISDNGKLDQGFDIQSLYEPFVVGMHLDTRSAGGLGLGLPITRKLIEMHGGEVELNPTDDRTIALIRLPAWRAKATT